MNAFEVAVASQQRTLEDTSLFCHSRHHQLPLPATALSFDLSTDTLLMSASATWPWPGAATILAGFRWNAHSSCGIKLPGTQPQELSGVCRHVSRTSPLPMSGTEEEAECDSRSFVVCSGVRNKECCFYEFCIHPNRSDAAYVSTLTQQSNEKNEEDCNVFKRSLEYGQDNDQKEEDKVMATEEKELSFVPRGSMPICAATAFKEHFYLSEETTACGIIRKVNVADSFCCDSNGGKPELKAATSFAGGLAHAIEVRSDEQVLVALESKSVALYDCRCGGVAQDRLFLRSHPICGLWVTADRIVVGSDCGVCEVDFRSGAERSWFCSSARPCRSLSYGNGTVYGACGRQVIQWAATTGEVLFTSSQHTCNVTALCADVRSGGVISAAEDGGLHHWITR